MNVGVTSPADGFVRYEIALKSHGLSAVRTPTVKIVPAEDGILDQLRLAAERADVLFVTSERTIRFLWPDGSMPPVPVAAVGATTARAVRDAGGHVSRVGIAGSAALLDDITQLVDGKKVVYPRASGAHPMAITRLSLVAESVVSEIVYSAVPVAPPSDPVDAVTFASPSAVQGWLLSRNLTGIAVAAIGPTTAAALRDHGSAPDAVASVPSAAALATAISEFIQGRTQP